MMPIICKEVTMRLDICSNPVERAIAHVHTTFQDYDFNYSDGDEENEAGSADVENMYYVAKCKVSSCIYTSLSALNQRAYSEKGR